MSRSRKKVPIGAICCVKRQEIKKAKQNSNRKVRRLNDKNLASGGYYKKTNERYCWPDDGKMWHEYPKAYRK